MRWVDTVLLFCTGLVTAVNLLPLGARLSWLIDNTTHFRVQYLAATLVLLAVLAVRRRWRACVVLAAAGAVSAAAVAPYLPLGASSVVAGTERITVLSVNVSFQQFSPRRLLEIIRDAAPDLVVVQELTPYTATALAPLDTTFAYNLKLPAEGPYGIALWSRLPLDDAAPFALGRQPAIEAHVRAPSGTFTLLGVHLNAPTTPRRAAARNGELRSLAALSAAVDGPLIVAGDFNTTPYSPYFVEWLAASGLTDTRQHRTLRASWPTALPIAGIPIDHVAVSKHFAILAHHQLPDFGSDHFGVLVELALRAPETP